MIDFSHFRIKRTDAERCLVEVGLCSDSEVMKCPCCCYFLDKRNTMIIEEIVKEIDELPQELTIIRIPLLPTPETIYYYSFDGIETIIYNLFKTNNKKLIEQLEKIDTFFKVYYEKDPLFTIPQIIIEIIFLKKLKSKVVDELWGILRNEIIMFTASVGNIINLKINNANDLIKAFQVPLLIGIDAFEYEGALKKHNFSSEQIIQLNYLHSVTVLYLKMVDIINNKKLTLFDEQRESIQKEKEEKLRNDKDVIEAIDAIFSKRNVEEEQEEELDDLPF